ncbi:hypothetical protein NCCP2716_30960 [Sporosarcina sp. NCCP-2716]|nr:hypothetical protein NCCP2716_30960 [Sporosarcina sp. NCCP-2716]
MPVKIGLIAAAVLVIGLITTHLVLKNMYDPDKKIADMNTAYNTQDAEGLFKQFTLKEGSVGHADSFYKLVKQYGWSDLREQLSGEAIKATSSAASANIIETDGEFISVTSKHVLFGLYKDVNFTILPTDLTVKVPLKNTSFTFDGQKFTTKEDNEVIELGKYIPGDYAWAYETKGSLMPLSGKGTSLVESTEDNAAKLDIDWNLADMTLGSNDEKAVVYIDGKSTKKTVAELADLYPVQFNKDISIHAVTKDSKGKEVKSDVVPMDKGTLYLTFDHIAKEQEAQEKSEEAKREQSADEDWVRSLYKEFRNDYERAIYYADFDYIEQYFQDGTAIRRDYAKFVNDHSTIPGYSYNFMLNDVTSVKTVAAGKVELYSFETFDFYSYEDGDLNYERQKKYVFVKVNDQYYIESITDLNTKKRQL